MKTLPDYFVSALDMSAHDHLDMMAAVQPFVDTSISKTVNVPADYPFDAFKDLYFDAWQRGLKGLATYRPNETLGAVLSVTPEAARRPIRPIRTSSRTRCASRSIIGRAANCPRSSRRSST